MHYRSELLRYRPLLRTSLSREKLNIKLLLRIKIFTWVSSRGNLSGFNAQEVEKFSFDGHCTLNCDTITEAFLFSLIRLRVKEGILLTWILKCQAEG